MQVGFHCVQNVILMRRKNKESKNHLNHTKSKHTFVSLEERAFKRAIAFATKVSTMTDSLIIVDPKGYTSSKEKIEAKCSVCGYCWSTRADHLLSRPWSGL